MPQTLYLASPYSSPDAAVREARFAQACAAAAHLMREGHVVYSPIAHGHAIATRHDLPTDWTWWQGQCLALLSRCDGLVVLALEGWNESVGVKAEIAAAAAAGQWIGMMWPDGAGWTCELALAAELAR